jgi:ribonuclease HII
MLILGIDENGLGPLLGPLVVTAAAFEAQTYDREAFFAACQGTLVAEDSKNLFSKARLHKAELETLAWLQAMGIRAATALELSEAIIEPAPLGLGCFGHGICSIKTEPPQLPCFGGHSRGDTPSVHLRGIRPLGLKAVRLCPGRYNAALASGINKLELDFRLMYALVSAFSNQRQEKVLALCGKVGATRSYGSWLGRAGALLFSTSEETPEKSVYDVSGLGTLVFEKDADSLHLPVAVASMVGKYLRELAMRDLNRALGRGEKNSVSGYRDLATKAFVDETEALRDSLGWPQTCFLRQA